ncbi:MAG TPA: site-specific integrase [Methylocella sp.]|jgi:integrase
MPRKSKGAHTWLRPARRDATGKITEAAVWIILDGGKQISTTCGAHEGEEAERRLADYIASKYAPERRERPLSEIKIADVIGVYLDDVAPGLAQPEKAGERAERLLEFFGDRQLDEITGALCREYEAWRKGKGRTNKGTGGGARRDLQDLTAAINHHAREGLHRGIVRVVLPKRGEARQRWLERDEFAKLLWICWRAREVQNGRETDKRPLRHLCRFLLLGIYTGSRPGAVFSASWERAPGRSWVDVERGVFHRHMQGAARTNKRQPTVRLAPGLLAHLRRWKRIDAAQPHVVTFNGVPVADAGTALARACKLAGIEGGVTAYTLRHSAASWLVAKGLPTRKIADFLGTSEQMIIDHYGHLAPDYQEEAALAIGKKNRFIGGNVGAVKNGG